MARGFATGLVQGTLICGAALVALSLSLPQPPRPGALPQDMAGGDGAAATGSAAVETVAESTATESTAPEPAAPAMPATETPATETPAAETLVLPAGSEFARASDMPPQAPALAEPGARRVASTPMVAPPADEVAPNPADPVGQRPEARGDAPAAPEIALPAPDPIDLPDPAGEAPIPVAPPGRVVVPGLDRAPERALAPAALVPEPAVQESAVQEAATPDPTAQAAPDPDPEPDATEQPAPSRQAESSGFDLSLPPDFTALRLTD